MVALPWKIPNRLVYLLLALRCAAAAAAGAYCAMPVRPWSEIENVSVQRQHQSGTTGRTRLRFSILQELSFLPLVSPGLVLPSLAVLCLKSNAIEFELPGGTKCPFNSRGRVSYVSGVPQARSSALGSIRRVEREGARARECVYARERESVCIYVCVCVRVWLCVYVRV